MSSNKVLNGDLIDFIVKSHIDNYLNMTFSKSHEVTDKLNQPMIGSHLITPRNGYTHHGIYIGNGQVIHYSGLADSLTTGPVERVSLDNFCVGKGFKEKAHNSPKFSREKIVERAQIRLKEQDYNLIFNNCEHFVHWCIYDYSKSDQVDLIGKTVPIVKNIVATKDVAQTFYHYINGNIDKDKLYSELTQTAFSTATIGYYAAVAQVAIPIPVIGAMAGAALGFLISKTLTDTGLFSFGAHSNVIAARKRREEIEKICNTLIPHLEVAEMELSKYFERIFSEKRKNISSIFESLEVAHEFADSDKVIKSLSNLANEFNGKLSFNSQEDFNAKYF